MRRVVAFCLLVFCQAVPDTKYEWAGCENLGKCKHDDFSTPPLLVLSFDGFAREYLDRKIVKSLEEIAKCGAKAERVYPSFPSKTFPNHYTMMTGLYPESHGITDNNVFDINLSPDLMKMKVEEAGPFYGGEPIWSAYKRLTGRPAHCLFWVGCYFNNTGYAPDIAPPYNEKMSTDERIETILSWLTLPEKVRPGLITAYLHHPDSAGHNQKSRKDVDDALELVDAYIDQLFTRLYRANILECINIVIVSDHGMQLLNKSVLVPEHIDMDGLILAEGVVARLHRNGTSKSVSDIETELSCKSGMEGVKVNTRESIPVRKHYSKTDRVGDIILEGKAGTAFYKIKNNGDHGYDYYLDNMHTIMFARGPAFRQNVVAPAYQNTQYMNLWLSLLGIEGAIENNGTIGFFDSILERPPMRENNWDALEECDTFGSDDVLGCTGLSEDERCKLSSRFASCPKAKSFPIYSKNLCFRSYCHNSVIVNRNPNDRRKTIIETLSERTSRSVETFFSKEVSYLNTKYTIECPFGDQKITVEKKYKTTKMTFFTSGSNALSQMVEAQFDFPQNFITKIFDPLQAKTAKYLKKFKKLYVISGIATDENRDGIADEQPGNATHFYRILITCTGTWLSTNPPLCKPNEMKTLSFIFPILSSQPTLDCMDPDEILLDYTATIFDVEQIAGFRFEIGPYSPTQNIHLRRNITTSLW